MCCSSFLKIMMFIFNGSIFLAGAGILGLGIWVKVDSDSFLQLVDETGESSITLLSSASYALIAVGALLLVIGFLGCCGACRESKCMLLTFFSLVLIIFLIEVAGAVVLFVFQGFAEEIFQELETQVKDKIRAEYGTEDSPVTSLWDTTMEGFECCGFSNYTDFMGSPFVNTNGLYPQPCCHSASQCTERTAEMSDVIGCHNKLMEFLVDNALIVAGVILGIAALEIAAMVVSMVLYCQVGSKT